MEWYKNESMDNAFKLDKWHKIKSFFAVLWLMIKYDQFVCVFSKLDRDYSFEYHMRWTGLNPDGVRYNLKQIIQADNDLLKEFQFSETDIRINKKH